MNNKSFWFYFESYVHVFFKKNDLLLYSALTGSIILYKNKTCIVRFVKRLRSKRNCMAIKVNEDYLRSNLEIFAFIKKVKKYFMGDIIDTDIAATPPFSMVPYFNLMTNPERIKKESTRSVGENVINYLKEISIYINSECSYSCLLCKNAFKQFMFCHKNNDNEEIDYIELKKFFSQANFNLLNRINLLGGDIFKHSGLKEIVEMLKYLPVQKTVYVHYKNIIDRSSELKLFNDDLITFHILADSPIDLDIFDLAIESLSQSTLKYHFIFPVKNSLEIDTIDFISRTKKLKNAILFPYYNSRNISFFKRNIYIKNQKMIQDSKPTKKEIFSRMVFNCYSFGKIFISSDGKIYANFNSAPIGKLGTDSIYDVLYKEIFNGRSWRKLRTKVMPCKNCIYNLLCPPISNYEYVIGKNNLCSIKS